MPSNVVWPSPPSMHVYSHKCPNQPLSKHQTPFPRFKTTNPHQGGFRAISVREVGLQAFYLGPVAQCLFAQSPVS